MNIRSVLFLLCLIVVPLVLTGQEKTNKELKEERKLEKQKQIDSLVNSRTFVFVGTKAYPQSGRSVNLTTSPNFVKFSPDLIDSDMPFFGRVYSGAGYGGSDGGLTFKGAPTEFTVKETKKGYQIDATVKGERDTYRLSLAVGSEGTCSLSIFCNNRSSMSYSGDISSP
jgi:hypothetical protein